MRAIATIRWGGGSAALARRLRVCESLPLLGKAVSSALRGNLMSASPEARRKPIVPFWNRLRAISLYPAHMAALVPIVMFALGKLLGFLPVLGFILALLVTVAMYRYAFDCLIATCPLYTSPSPRDRQKSRMPSSA
mgnify:CR=1 FL=1